MGSKAPPGIVMILSRLLLMAQTIGAALRYRGIEAVATTWPEGLSRATYRLTGSDLVLLLDDLEDRDSVQATQALIAGSAARFLVLSPRAEGAAWGAMLASGAVAVMPAASSLDQVDAALALARRGGTPFSEGRRNRLVDEWVRWLAEDDRLRTRLARLSPREREVLVLLSQGTQVADIVTALGVAETTVRSHIRSIRRKLGVGSQLAAVAVVRRLGGGLLDVADADGADVPGPREPPPGS